jgi:acetyltransferase-like isoleucine patch superfamily enzyme
MVKRTLQACALALVAPAAFTCFFGRFVEIYTMWAQWYALFPGKPGNFLRAAFYRLTLRRFSQDSNISFGTYFVHPDCEVGGYVSVGSYCVIGLVSIGAGTQIASHVEIPSGKTQHTRDAAGRLSDVVHHRVTIGEFCWIGASAVVLADVGAYSTIGAGSVVVKDIPPHAVAVGNPARVIREAVSECSE